MTDFGCSPFEKWAIVVHGWTETVRSYWVTDLMENLQKYRGGCTVFMDYSYFSSTLHRDDYFKLQRKYPQIADMLLQKLKMMEEEGFDPKKGFMFGFSLGARIVIEAARNFGEKKIKEIDVCDAAGPGKIQIKDQ